MISKGSRMYFCSIASDGLGVISKFYDFFLDIIALRAHLLAELGLRRAEDLLLFSEQPWDQ